MNIRCPHCQALYRIDPGRIPPGGVRARCARCGEAFPVGVLARSTDPGEPRGAGARLDRPSHEREAAPRPPATPGYATTEPARTPAAARGSPFGAQDPNARAQRIARALVSDIVAYNRDRRDRSLAAGTLRTDFREEIMKSWQEYVEQVGQELAKNTPFFRDSLNEILAQGRQAF
jgi:predicted Zn finger-like uncharacterized protein